MEAIVGLADSSDDGGVCVQQLTGASFLAALWQWVYWDLVTSQSCLATDIMSEASKLLIQKTMMEIQPACAYQVSADSKRII